jgi:sporulation protein YpjB
VLLFKPLACLKRIGSRWLPLCAAACLAAAVFAGAASGPAPRAAAAPASAGPAGAQADASVRSFLQAAEALYAAAGGGQGDLSGRLREVENRLRALPMSRIATAEGIEALAENVSEMKRAVAAVRPDPGRRQAAAAAIRLSADALAHPEQPLWHRYRTLLRSDADELQRELKDAGWQPTDEARATLNRLSERYRLIRTAALLRGEPSAAERADAVLRYAERLLNAPQPDPKLLEELVPPLRGAMDGLFPGGEAAAASMPVAVPPPWGVPAAIASFIVTVLSWEGWRRYRRGR